MTTTSAAPPGIRPLLNWGIPLTITASFAWLALQQDLRDSVPLLVAVTGGVTVLLAASLYAAGRGRIAWSPTAIVAVALLLRLFFLFRPPQLSDDVFRYLWDGLQTLSGSNPYRLPPAVAPAKGAAEALRGLVNHPELVTIYPPAAQLLFAAGAFLGKSVLGVKLLLTALDLAACLLILRLLKVLRLPPERAVLYAWHPLPVLEIAGSGHVDGAGLLCLLIALNLVADRFYVPGSPFYVQASSRPALPSERAARSPGALLPAAAGAACACAALVKLLPLVFLPAIIVQLRGRDRTVLLAGMAAGAALLTVPFLPELRNGFGTLALYARDWEFAGCAFRTLRRLMGSGQGAREILALLFCCSAALLYRSLLAEQDDPLRASLRACYGVACAFLLLTPTLHPWYALSLAVFLPFAGGGGGLVLCWAVFLAYRVLIPYHTLGLWIEDDLTAAWMVLAPAAAFLAVRGSRIFRRGGRRAAEATH